MATAFGPAYDTMTAHGPTSPTFIKPEPDEFFGSHKFNKDESHFHAGNNYGPWQASNIDPSNIPINGNNNMTHPQQINNSSQGLPSNIITNTSMLSDEDLIGSFSMSNEGQQQMQQQQQTQNQYQMMGSYQGNFAQHMQPGAFSSTPDGAPIQSPFNNGFNFNRWEANPSQGHRMSQQMSRSISGHGMQDAGPHMSPMTPNGMQIGSHSMHHQGSMSHQGHQRNSSNQWDNSIGSGYSQPFDSPLGSPSGGPVHQISEVLKSGASAPSPAARVNGRPTTTAEQKKAKRRASHNEVERRRRNHINDRIMELAKLVPSHRLEDEAVKRSNFNSAAMPGPSGLGFSPPGASSMVGSHGRRAGSVSQGPLADDKDKGPAKGEVLDGAVFWTRDLLWLVHNLLDRDNQMRATIASMNGPAPKPFTEEEIRMLSEAKAAIAHNAGEIQSYTRRDGSDLFVPGHTDRTGARIAKESVSPSTMFDLEQNHSIGIEAGAGADYVPFYKSEDEILGDMDIN